MSSIGDWLRQMEGMAMDTYREFWVVWREDGGTPTVKHDSEGAAVAEAERLARANQGHRFWVLRSLAVCRVTNVQWQKAHANECACSDCIPF